MDAVNPAKKLAQSSADLGSDIERMQAEMDRAIQLGGLKSDPTLPMIKALSASLGLQWRLHEQAVGYFRSASDRLDQQLAETIAQGELALETRRIGIVESLLPELVKLTTRNAQTWRRVVTLKTALAFGGLAVALALGFGMAGYGLGWQTGHDSAANAEGVLRQAGPDAETAIVAMLRVNNLADAWAKCRETATANRNGRRVCAMPMWAEPEGAANSVR